MIKTIVAATGNAHKLKELRAILKDWQVVSAGEAGFLGEVEETGSTFAENAALKARAVCEATGLPALADDSGLCVEALNGAPGVYSARYFEMFATEEERRTVTGERRNRRLLLKRMEGVENRRAYFCCALALVLPDGGIVRAEGRTYGQILLEERGENGFGYDSLFLSDDLQKSFGEAGEEEKNSVSHRGRALKELVKLL